MTPLAFVQELADDVAATPLPKPNHAQLGEAIIDCPGVIVTVLTMTEVDPTGGGGTGHCEKIEMANLAVYVSRDCSFVANEDGTTNWDHQNVVSAHMNADATVLWDLTEKWRAAAWYLAPGFLPTLTFTNIGGLGTVSLTLQLPVP